MGKYLDETGLRHFWEKVKEQTGNSSTPTMTHVTLLSDGWDENSQQLVEVPGVLADEAKQLIIPTPFKADAEQYYSAGIRCTDQLDGRLQFSAETVPEVDLQVYVVVMDVKDAQVSATYEWWSPHMTSDNTPAPYSVSASSVAGNNPVWCAFDGVNTTMFHSQNSANSWIMFDFGTITPVKGIRFVPYPDTTNDWYKAVPKKFDVEKSLDGVSWDTLFASDGTLYPTVVPGVAMDYRFNLVGKTRFLRITNRENYGVLNYFIVSEIEFLRR